MFNTKIIGADHKVFADSVAVAELLAAYPAKLFSVVAYNSSAFDLYLFVYDSAAQPADGTWPTIPPVKIPKDTTGGYDWTDGIPMGTGVYVCWSTTPNAKAQAIGGPILFSARKTP